MNNLDIRINHLPYQLFATTISEIDQIKGRWGAFVRLTPATLSHLQRSALITSAGASTRIEGALMTDAEVRAVIDGLNITKLRDRDRAEVAGYLDAASFINDNYKDIRLTENHIKQLHQILLGHSAKDSSHRGKYKHMPNDVIARDAAGQAVGVVFHTLPPLQTPMAMSTLLAWLQHSIATPTTHPLLVTANFIVEFLSIHPFIDGNGRLSRLLTNLLMLKSGFSYTPYVSMEKIIESRKADYYMALRRSQSTFGSDHEDITTWVQFFLDVCLEQARSADNLITTTSVETKLSPSQAEIYRLVIALDDFAVRDIEARTDIPRPTIRQALEKLESLGVIMQLGSGRGAHYRVIR